MLVNSVVIFLFLFSSLGASRRKKLKVANKVSIEDVGLCFQENSDTMHINYSYVRNNNYLLNVAFETEEQHTDVTFFNYFRVCESQSEVLCNEVLYDYKIEKFCDYLDKPHEKLWENILAQFTPKIKCPIQGKYALIGLNTSALQESMLKDAPPGLDLNNVYYQWVFMLVHQPQRIPTSAIAPGKLQDLLTCMYIKVFFEQYIIRQ